MKIAVLGGTGRTGRLIVQELLDRGHEVTRSRTMTPRPCSST